MKCADWADFKNVCVTTKSLRLQFEEWDDRVRIVGPDANDINWEITLSKKLVSGEDNPDYSDFDSVIRSTCNKPIVQLDSDGASMSRTKVAPSGWNFNLRGIEFKTSVPGSMVNRDAFNADLADATLKLYDAQGALITDPTTALASCVKTVLDIEPPYDIYIAGGHMRLIDVPTTNARVSVIGVPDVPANAGGSKQFVQNINLRFIPITEGVNADGRAAKWLQYNATYHTNKIRFVIYHNAGAQVEIETMLETYRV